MKGLLDLGFSGGLFEVNKRMMTRPWWNDWALVFHMRLAIHETSLWASTFSSILITFPLGWECDETSHGPVIRI